MKASELLGSSVIDGAGTTVGAVVDVLLTHRGEPRVGEPHLAVSALVVDRVTWPHRWGMASGRSHGPLLLGLLARAASRNARRVPVGQVADWQPGLIRLRSRP